MKKTKYAYVVEVVEEIWDFTGRIETADSIGSPSTSARSHGPRVKKKLTKKKRKSGTESDQESTARDDEKLQRKIGRTGKVTRKGKTSSTPETKGRGMNVKIKLKGRLTARRDLRSLDKVKKKLDKGLRVSLSPSSASAEEGRKDEEVEFEST